MRYIFYILFVILVIPSFWISEKLMAFRRSNFARRYTFFYWMIVGAYLPFEYLIILPLTQIMEKTQL